METYAGDKSQRLASNGMYRLNLKETIEEIDLEPFDLEEPLFEDYSEFMDSLEMFEELDAITVLRKGERVRVTDHGRRMAEPLVDVLTDEQEQALADAGIEFEFWHRRSQNGETEQMYRNE